MSEQAQLLAVLPEVRAGATLDHLRSLTRITQVASPRVVVVECDQPETLRSIPGVVVLAPGEDAPAGVTEHLDDAEALFVAAWASQTPERSRERPGEGLAWDSPGFEPPDPPPGTSGAGRRQVGIDDAKEGHGW